MGRGVEHAPRDPRTPRPGRAPQRRHAHRGRLARAGGPGDLTLVSASSAGVQGTTASDANAVSADGRFVAFTSASALTATPTGGKVQFHVRDRTTDATTLAPSSTRGAAAGADVDTQDVGKAQFSISGDGNATTVARTITRSAPATSTPRPRARVRLPALRAALTKPRGSGGSSA